MPTGWRSAPSSFAVSMWRFDWMKATEANRPWFTLLAKATNGFSKRTVMVWGSSTSMLLIRRNSGAREFAEPSFARDAKVNRTSSAVKGSPLWNLTPLRRLNVHVRPLSVTFQRSASMGAGSPLASRVSRFSYIGLRTMSSAPA